MTEQALLRPFAGLRPAPGRAADVIAPPYDVVDTAEAAHLVSGRPHSFLHISRAEVDLRDGIDPYDAQVYRQARANLDRLREEGVLRPDPAPCYYVYRLERGGRCQTGLVAGASVAAYQTGRIKKHELTRPAKEDDRVRHIDALNAQTGPVFLAHRASPTLRELLGRICAAATPEIDVEAADGVRHRLWVVARAHDLAALTAAADALPALYIADGHHRAAAAARVAAERGNARQGRFLAVSFPHDELDILPYNRVIRDLAGLDCSGILEGVEARFFIESGVAPVQPLNGTHFGLYCDGRWSRLRLRERYHPDGTDPVAQLAVSLLHEHLVAPVLGITDARRDSRIDFVGGSRGLEGLMAAADAAPQGIALSLAPTAIEDLFAVADAGAIMPPKSTWFEPKLADGLVSLVLG
jgi:uncharacterized protein (DUF1015 family)